MFEGYYLNNKKWNGRGYDIKGNIIYELINGKGIVKEYYEDYIIMMIQLIYEGEYKNGERNGKGKQYYIIGNLEFEGEYLRKKERNIIQKKAN